MIGKYLLVSVIAASPIGEELVAIPVGIALGLPPLGVMLVALVANYLPAPLISLLFQRAERSTGPLRWLLRLRSQRVAAVLDRAGIVGIVVVTPWVGVYSVVVTMELLGMRRARIQGAVLSSLASYALIITVAAAGILG